MRGSRLLSMLFIVSALSVTVSCSTDPLATDPSLVASSANLQSIVTPALNGLFPCNPQAYAFAQKTIGPNGGTITVGRHSLTIPAGALSSNVLITGEAPSDSVVSVRFFPEGLQFAKSAKLTLDYSNCPLASLMLLKRVAYTSDDLNILSFLLSTDNLLTHKVSAGLGHFSRYAVAW